MTKKCNRLRGERPKAFWGALVGGASLVADKFARIVNYVAK